MGVNLSIFYTRSLCMEIYGKHDHIHSRARNKIGKCNLKKSGGHILIYPEGKTVKLIVSDISLPVLERYPPWDSSVISCALCIKCVVKKCSNDYRHRRR